MPINEILLLIAGGVGAGLIGSLFGLGGGILIIPILSLLLDVPMHNAVATSLMCVIATSSAAASRNVAKGIANVRLGMTLELWTVAGAMVGGLLAGLLPGKALMILFASAISLMAIPMARGLEGEAIDADTEGHETATGTSFLSTLSGEFHDPARGAVVSYQVARLPLAMGVSSIAGVLSGLLGVGGGIIKVPILSSYCDVPIKAAAATSNFMIGVTAVTSAMVFFGRDEVIPMLTGASVIGVFAGSRIGSVIGPKIHAERLRQAFAIVMVVIAMQMFWRALTGDVR